MAAVIWCLALWFCIGNVHDNWINHSLTFYPSIYGLTRALILTLLIAPCLSNSKNFSSLALAAICFFSAIPVFVIFNSMGIDGNFDIAVLICFIIISIISRSKWHIDIRLPPIAARYSIYILGLISASTFALTIYYVPFSYYNHGIFDIEAVRALNAANFPLYLKLLGRWQGYVLTPFWIILAIKNKSIPLGFIAAGMSLFLFQLTGFKSFILASALPPLVFYILNHSTRPQYYAFLVLSIISCIGIFSNNGYIYMVGVRRAILTPQTIQCHYYDYFSSNPPVGIEVPFIRYDPPLSRPAELVSSHILGNSSSNMISGMFGAGYAASRYGGMLLFAAVAAFFIKLLCLSRPKGQLNDSLIASLSSPMLIPLLGTSPLLIWVSYGGIITIALSVIIFNQPSKER